METVLGQVGTKHSNVLERVHFDLIPTLFMYYYLI